MDAPSSFGHGRDQANGSGGMELHTLERMLSDMEHEPKWRESADKCADYYDHKQSSAARIERSAKTGEPMSTINLIQRTINGALGQEAKTRLDWKVQADSDAFGDVAAVLNERLHEMQREARTDMAISEAYSSMLRTGIGWVEVSQDPNPLNYPYRVRAVHRNQVWWDWRARQPDKSDARWIVRQQWVDLDEAIVMMPQHRELLEVGCHSGPITDVMARTIMQTRGTFDTIHDVRRSFSRSEEEWLDNSVRRRVRFYSVYYKQPVQAVAMVMGSKRVKFNPKNPVHVALVQRGAAKLMRGPSETVRHAMFAGPFRLFDVPLPGRRFPLVPFVCYQCDDDFSPYGLVHGMIEPQDEFNERRSRLLWLLKAKQVFVDSDALDERFNTLQDLALEVMRPDAMFVLKANRANANALRVEHNLNLSAEQTAVMNDAKQLIQDVPGLFAPQFGSNSVGANSGIALNTLMEQSSASLGETSDNYRMARREVGELAMALVIQDHLDADMQVAVGAGRKRRTVVLNTMDEQGMPLNQVEDAQVKVALGDVPSTPAYRGQQQVFLSQAIQAIGNDPISRAVLVPALLEASDIEHREEYAKWMRQKAGVPEPGDLADEDATAQMQQAQMAQQQAAQEMQQRAAMADVAKREADAGLAQAKAARETVGVERERAELAMAMQPPVPMEPQPPSESDLIDEALAEALAA